MATTPVAADSMLAPTDDAPVGTIAIMPVYSLTFIFATMAVLHSVFSSPADGGISDGNLYQSWARCNQKNNKENHPLIVR